MFSKEHQEPRGKSRMQRLMRNYLIFFVAAVTAALLISAPAIAVQDSTQASYNGSVTNTRHNLTMSFSTQAALMNGSRNNYEEVCVYCHTPHAGNGVPNMPLWNHTMPAGNSFTVYAGGQGLNQLTSTIGDPGPSSLTCLSCHDGTIAIDSVINMPTLTNPLNPAYSGWDANQDTVQSDAFLNTWKQLGGKAGPPPGAHRNLTSGECFFCHDGSAAQPFQIAEIGKDLTNDHPIGMIFPAASGPAWGFKQPSDTTADGRIMFFEDAVGGSGAPSTNNNNRLSANEIRLYNSSGGAGAFEVECASCHDPHGVPSDGSSAWGGAYNTPGLSRSGVQFNASFLRISNSDSDVCLTCHDK